MTLKERLIATDVLDRHHPPARRQLEYPIDQQEGIAVWQDPADRRDVARATVEPRALARPLDGGEQLAHELGVELVARAMGHDMPGQVDPQQGQVADHVQDLVADAFVVVAEGVAYHPFGPEDEQVGVGRPRPHPLVAQGVGLGLEQEGPAGGKLGPEILGADLDEPALAADGRLPAVVEVIRQHQAIGGTWVRSEGRVPLAHRDGPVDDVGWPGLALIGDARVIQGLDEGLARPVAAGGLGPIDLDDAIVDLEPGERGHDVLDHLDDGRAILDGRAPLSGDDLGDVGADGRRSRQVGSDEDDALS